MEYKIKIIRDEVIGVINIREDSQFNQISADKVVVSENITARLFGKAKHVVLKKGAKLFFHGRISGLIENKGGQIFLYSK